MNYDPHTFPRISFTFMVLNGEPFVKYLLNSLYPHAHEIIVAEGAVRRGKINSTPDGHSIDHTVSILHEFKKNHDPENKLKIIQLDRFWEGSTEMSQACTAAATGDYVWENGVDEFYLDESIEKTRKILSEDPTIDGMSFRWHNFWGSKNYTTRGWLEFQGGCDQNRLFRWGEGFTYTGHHTSPTSISPEGDRMIDGNWLTASETMRMNLYCHHYAFVFPLQVLQKSRYYSGGGNLEEKALRKQDSLEEAPNLWANDVWLNLKKPFRVHNVDHLLSWLERYEGKHPAMALRMFEDIESGKYKVDTRNVEDIEALLNSFTYKLGRRLITLAGKIYYSNCHGRIRTWAHSTAQWIERALA